MSKKDPDDPLAPEGERLAAVMSFVHHDDCVIGLADPDFEIQTYVRLDLATVDWLKQRLEIISEHMRGLIPNSTIH